MNVSNGVTHFETFPTTQQTNYHTFIKDLLYEIFFISRTNFTGELVEYVVLVV